MALDYTGLMVTGHYINGTVRDLTAQCTFSPTEGTLVTSPGTIVVDVSHGNLRKRFAMTALAGQITASDDWYTLYDNGFMDVHCYGEMPDSSHIDDYPNKYFKWLDISPVTFVLFEDMVTVIGEYAFSGCTNLVGVLIGSGVTTIEDQAFSRCSKLTQITIPHNVTSIGHGIVEETPVTSITIPDSISIIPSYMCFECKQLTHVELPDTITEIRYGAFQECSSLREITIPPHVTFLGQNLFTDSALTHITIPDSVTRIDESAFSRCDNLTDITIPNSVTEMGEWLFSSCAKDLHKNNFCGYCFN